MSDSVSSRDKCPSTTYPASESVEFVAHGLAGPKGSRNVSKNGKTYEQSRIATQWTQDVALQTRSAMIRYQLPKALAPPYSVGIAFVFPYPKSPTWEWPTKGDLDKLVRATLDGLQQGGLVTEDKHVISLFAQKRWGDDARATIRVETIYPL